MVRTPLGSKRPGALLFRHQAEECTPFLAGSVGLGKLLQTNSRAQNLGYVRDVDLAVLIEVAGGYLVRRWGFHNSDGNLQCDGGVWNTKLPVAVNIARDDSWAGVITILRVLISLALIVVDA